METFSKSLLAVHIFCGFSSIILFWIPIFLKKGSNLHIKVGKVYVFLMWIVVISSLILSIENFIQGYIIPALFLGFLAVITANPLWYGIAILKHKKGLPDSYRKKHMLFNLVVAIFGAVLLAYGIYLKGEGQGILMIIFGILGVLTGGDIYRMYKNPIAKSNWIKEHIAGMMISGIACYTAFIVFGGRTFFGQIFTGSLMIIPWVLPTVVGIIFIKYYQKSYLVKKGIRI